MSIPLSHVKEAIIAYTEKFPRSDLQSLQPLLEAINTSDDITARTHLPGHVTTSAVILNEENKVLHIKHKILNTWLLPGGHCENADSTLVSASLREVYEETGIPSDCLKRILPENVPIDIDLHPIPANPRKGEPVHWHADFRFAYRLVSIAKVALQEEEVTDYAWLPLEQMPMRGLANRLYDFIKTSTTAT
jgi:8-oxo-dGTP pyrophosphatase MutT (NUDIX family)